MRFNFHLANAAANNVHSAKLRESTRMACIAHGLHQLGHDVAIVDAAVEFRGSTRRPFVAHLFEGHHKPGLEVHSAESTRGRDRFIDVGIKCSVGTANDEWFLKQCKVVVAHEYDLRFDDHPKLLPVPFLIHDTVIEQFIKDGLFEAYLTNDIEKIRAFYRQPIKRTLGFCGTGWKHRIKLCEFAPSWADVRLFAPNTDDQKRDMTAADHIRWLMECQAALALPGSSPKTNLPPLLALLGIPIVAPPIPVRDTPPMSDKNTIVFQWWEQVRQDIADTAKLNTITEQATKDYLESWSPLGIARLIAERLA